MSRPLDVLVLGYYGFGNLGDELLAEAVVSLLVRNGIKLDKIGVLSADPVSCSARLGVRAFNRWSMGAMAGAMKMSRTFLLGGGGLFQDSTSFRSCFYYWWAIRLAKLNGAVPWAVGQSIGPLYSRISAFLARSAMKKCAFCGVRDKRSHDLLASWGITSELAPDLVMALRLHHASASGSTLLLNVRPGYDDVEAETVKFAVSYAKKNKLHISGVAFSDEDVAELRKISDSNHVKLDKITVVKSVSDFEDIIVGSAAALGMRLHFIILSAMAGLPVCGAAYDPKVSSFCAEWGVNTVGGDTGFTRADAGKVEGASEEVSSLFGDALHVVLGESYGER